ncbi:hypothetical protein OROMI_026612 [Orobanche minor]
MEIACSTTEAFSLEIATIASRVLLGLIYVRASATETSVQDGFAFKLIGKGKKAQGENVDDGKIDDDSGQAQQYGGANGENGDTSGGEWHNSDDNGDDYESDEQYDASDQEGNDDHGRGEEDDDDYDENGDEEDVDEKFTDEDEDDATSGSDTTGEDPLLSHAMEVYNPDSFYLFKHEYEKSRVLSLDVTDESGLDFKYKVKKMEFHGHSCKVTASFIDGIVECCCNHFAVTGMLCSHALAVLNCLHIEKIPDRYLLKWRMKNTNPGLMEMTSFRGRRQIHPSLDDCLTGDLGRGSIKTKAYKEDSPRLIWPRSEDDKCTNINHFGSPILRHAKQIYAPDTYDLFREEHRKSGYLLVQILHNVADWRGLVYEFEVSGPGYTDVKKVHAEAKDGTVKCICRKFETCGILCSHALAAYSSICVVRIPQQYIVPKLLKDPNFMYVQQQQIHGPEYQKMLRFVCYMFQATGSTTLRSSLRFVGEEDDRIKECLAEIKDELRSLSQDHGDKERREMVFKGKKGRFYDDQLIKDFTYKKSETRKRKLMDCLSSSPLNFF